MYVAGEPSRQDLQELSGLGITGILGPASLGERAREAGLELYACGGAFPAGDHPPQEDLALDIRGRRQLWFGSCCPNHQPTREGNLEGYRAMAQAPGVSGLVMDGARFSSPASSLDLDSVFTCFCPRCAAKMDALGLDPERVRAGVSALYAWLREGGERPREWRGVHQWLDFRRICAGEHLKDFARVAREEGMAAGAFFFPPSLGRLVGQSYRDMGDSLDVIFPMLYPAYPEKPGDPGTACLNWELFAMGRLLTLGGAMSHSEALRALSGWVGVELPPPAQLRREVPRALVGKETARAIREGKPAQIVPILQLDDPKLEASMAQAEAAGAQALAFFAWEPALPGNWKQVLARTR